MSRDGNIPIHFWKEVKKPFNNILATEKDKKSVIG
jgi:hypothetical protein